MSKDIPIPAHTGKHAYISFRVRKLGEPRNLVANNDVVRFVVVREGTIAPIITKTTDAGITQDPDGWGQITLTPTDLARSNFDPNYDYEYDLEITEGDTDVQWTLSHGPFMIELSPQ